MQIIHARRITKGKNWGLVAGSQDEVFPAGETRTGTGRQEASCMVEQAVLSASANATQIHLSLQQQVKKDS